MRAEGATVSGTLRDDGFDGEIQLIGAEAQLPYNRPPLSKGYFRQEERFEEGIVRAAVGLSQGGDQEDPNASGELKVAVNLIRNGVAVDPAELIDESVDWWRLLPAR